jgi:hypothetical protein
LENLKEILDSWKEARQKLVRWENELILDESSIYLSVLQMRLHLEDKIMGLSDTKARPVMTPAPLIDSYGITSRIAGAFGIKELEP